MIAPYALPGDTIDVYLQPMHYRIVKSGKRASQDTKSVDVSLEEQRDANLRQVFG